MKIFAEARSGRPSAFRSPAATEAVSVNGGIADEPFPPQAPSAKTKHVVISRCTDVNGRASLSFVLAVLPGSGPANCVMPRNPLVVLTLKRRLVKPPVCIDVLSLI